jgi:hypothetical protein
MVEKPHFIILISSVLENRKVEVFEQDDNNKHF